MADWPAELAARVARDGGAMLVVVARANGLHPARGRHFDDRRCARHLRHHRRRSSRVRGDPHGARRAGQRPHARRVARALSAGRAARPVLRRRGDPRVHRRIADPEAQRWLDAAGTCLRTADAHGAGHADRGNGRAAGAHAGGGGPRHGVAWGSRARRGGNRAREAARPVAQRRGRADRLAGGRWHHAAHPRGDAGRLHRCAVRQRPRRPRAGAGAGGTAGERALDRWPRRRLSADRAGKCRSRRHRCAGSGTCGPARPARS